DVEIAKATTVLCEAFGWRFFTDALDNDLSLVPELLGAYLKAGLVGGQVYFAENASKEIVGVAIWFKPGQKSLGTQVFPDFQLESLTHAINSREQRAAGWDPLMGKLSQKCHSWWTDFLKILYDDFVEKTLGPGAMLGAFHLQLIGIHPDYQRQGI
ncbi:hypothetical protein B0H13DRAFT_1575374, partial [Mycena leptocephala]